MYVFGCEKTYETITQNITGNTENKNPKSNAVLTSFQIKNPGNENGNIPHCNTANKGHS